MKKNTCFLVTIRILLVSFSLLFINNSIAADDSTFPYQIVEKEFQKKGGTFTPLRPAMFTFIGARVVIKSDEKDRERIKRTLEKIVKELRKKHNPDAIAVWAYRSVREVKAGGFFSIGMATWEPAGEGFLSYSNRDNIMDKSSYILKIEIPDYIKPDEPIKKISISDNEKLNELNGFEDFQWSMTKEDALNKAKSIYKNVESGSRGIHVYVKEDYAELFTLEFVEGKLASVGQRFNNKEGKPPFSDNIIKQVIKRYGSPTVDRWEAKEHVRRWEGKNTIIEARNQKNEFYVDIVYLPRNPIKGKISQKKKLEIWNFYIKMERRHNDDVDKAIKETAKHFGIAEDDALNIKVEGGTKHRPID